MNVREERRGVNWVQLILNVLTSASICLGGLGIFVNLKLQPIENKIEKNSEDIEDNKEVMKSIHEMSKSLAVLANNYEHLKESVDKIRED